MSDLNNKTFSNRSNAVRALKRAGYEIGTYDLHKTGEGTTVRVTLLAPAATVDLTGAAAENQRLMDTCGFTHCPSCGIHLSNGVMSYEWLREEDAKGAASMTHEHECMGCGAGFGNLRANRRAGSTRSASTVRTAKATVVKAPRVKQNNVTKPLEGSSAGRVWAVCDRVYADLGVVPTVGMVRDAAELEGGFNPNQVTIEFYQWKKFNGFRKGA